MATHGVFVASRVSCCQIFLYKAYMIRISTTPSDVGDGLITVSKRSNSTFIMLYLYHEMDVDYLVVGEMVNSRNCLITIACLV
jgi:hypothetical protein